MVSIYQVMYFCCLASLAVQICPLVLSRCYGRHPAQGGYSRFQLTGLKFWIPGFFGSRKIWQVLIFLGHLIN